MSTVIVLLIVLRGANCEIVQIRNFPTLQQCEGFKSRVDPRPGDRLVCAEIPANQ
jgi:hypothetical protein